MFREETKMPRLLMFCAKINSRCLVENVLVSIKFIFIFSSFKSHNISM